MKRFFAFCLVLLLTLAIAATAWGEQAKVQGGTLRLRALPDEKATILATYRNGTIVTVLDTVGIWSHVRTASGLEGYMMSSFLGSVSTTPTPTGKGTTAYVTSGNGLPVVLRSGPSKSYSVLASYSVGTKVSVLSAGSTWSYISVNGKTGYMMSKYLTGEVIPTPGKTYSATVVSSNGYGVRLRSGPGTSYSVIGFYSVGTSATILSRGKTWDYVSIGNRKGYMQSTYLRIGGSTTNTPAPATGGTVAGVSIDKLNPKVGGKLTATVYPSGATAVILWYNSNDEQLGVGSTYTLTSAEQGLKIYCRAYGTGSWSGEVTSSSTNKVTKASSTTNTPAPATGGTVAGVSIDKLNPKVGGKVTATVYPAGATANILWYNSDDDIIGSGTTYTLTAAELGYKIYCRAIGSGDWTGDVTSSSTNKVTEKASTNTPVPTETPEPTDTPAPAVGGTVAGVSINKLNPKVGGKVTATVYPEGAIANILWYNSDDDIIGSGTTYTLTDAELGYKIYCRAIGTDGWSGDVTSSSTNKVTEKTN